MNSFYSIIYYRPNSLTDELLAVALLASGGEGPFLHISRRRLDLLKKILHPSQYTSVKRHFSAFARSVQDDQSSTNELLLFDPNYSKERLDELSRKTKGAVEYSRPVTINEWLDRSFFDELTSHFLGDSNHQPRRKRPVFQLKWKAFYRSNQFNDWEREVKMKYLNGLDIPFSADLYDKDQKVIVKGIDFDLNPATVNKKLEAIKLARASLSDHHFKLVHPAIRKKSGKAFVQSMDDTDQHLRLIKFTEFKKNL